MNNEQEMTAEEYKAKILKQNFANRAAEYEDVIATLQTQVAFLRQELEKKGADVPEQAAQSAEVLPPPPAPPE